MSPRAQVYKVHVVGWGRGSSSSPRAQVHRVHAVDGGGGVHEVGGGCGGVGGTVPRLLGLM